MKFKVAGTTCTNTNPNQRIPCAINEIQGYRNEIGNAINEIQGYEICVDEDYNAEAAKYRRSLLLPANPTYNNTKPGRVVLGRAPISTHNATYKPGVYIVYAQSSLKQKTQIKQSINTGYNRIQLPLHAIGVLKARG